MGIWPKRRKETLTAYCWKWKGRGWSGKKLDRHLYSSDGLPPRFYGLLKIYKNRNPLRPIVSLISSPTYNLFKHVAKILKPLAGNSAYTDKNSTKFCGSIPDINLQDELVSFDVVSLFTSTPVDVVVNVAYNRLVNDENLQERTALYRSLALSNYLTSACQLPTFNTTTSIVSRSMGQLWAHPFPP